LLVSGKQIAWTAGIALLVVVGFQHYMNKGGASSIKPA